MNTEQAYICEFCNHKSDRLKMCHGKKMVDIKYAVKTANNLCGC